MKSLIRISNIRKSMNIPLIQFFESIDCLQYFTIKCWEANQANNFPHGFYLKSDVDIIVDKSDFEALKAMASEFLSQHTESTFRLIEITEDNGSRFRLMSEDFLILQIDIRTKIYGLSEIFIENLWPIADDDSYKKLQIGDELIFRIYEYIQHPSKTWHLNFIRKYKSEFDLERIRNVFICNVLRDKALRFLKDLEK